MKSLPPGVWALQVGHNTGCPSIETQSVHDCTCASITYGQILPYMKSWDRASRRKAERAAKKAAWRAKR